MSVIVITLGGVDITSKVVIEAAHFESQVNGVAGEAKFRVRDDGSTYAATPGAEVLLTIDGAAAWRGFLTQWTRTYVFPALDVAAFGPARFFDATCSDINILLVRRIVFNQSTPEDVMAPLLDPHTPDTDALSTLFSDWLDLSGDGIDTSSLVQNVGDTTWTQAGRAWEGSDLWAQAVQSIASLPAAIYYIDPDENFVYTDVDTPSTDFFLADNIPDTAVTWQDEGPVTQVWTAGKSGDDYITDGNGGIVVDGYVWFLVNADGNSAGSMPTFVLGADTTDGTLLWYSAFLWEPNSTSVPANGITQPTAGNAHWYLAILGSKTGPTEPTWPTDGGTVVDGINGSDPNARGYREMEILKDGTSLANDVLAWGMGYGINQPVFVRNVDTDSQDIHGLWQLASLNFGVYKQATIDRIAESIIDGSPQSKRGAKDDRLAVTCVTYAPVFRVAQKVLFVSAVFDFSDVIPIRKMAIDFEAPDQPKFTLTLSHEIDTPFSLIDNFFFPIPKFNLCLPPMVMGPNGSCILPPLPPGVFCTDSEIDDFEGRTTSGGIWGDASSGPTWEDELADGDFAYVAGGVGVLLTQPFGPPAFGIYPETAPGGDQKLTFASPYVGESTIIIKFQPLDIADGQVTLFVRLSSLLVSVVMRPDFMSVLGGGVSSLGISQEDVDSEQVAPIPTVPTWETSGWWTLQIDYMPNQYARAQVWHESDPQPGPQVEIVPEGGFDIEYIRLQIGRDLGYAATVSTFAVTDFNGYLGKGIEYDGLTAVGWSDFSNGPFEGKAFGFCPASEFQAYAQVLEQGILLESPNGVPYDVSWVMEQVEIPSGVTSDDPFSVPASDWWSATPIGTLATGGGDAADYTSPGLSFGPYDIDVAGPTSIAWRITTTAPTPPAENYLLLILGTQQFYHGTPAADPDATQGLVVDDISSRHCILLQPFNGWVCEDLISDGTDTFPTQNTFLAHSSEVSVEGLLYLRSSYTESPLGKTITLGFSPDPGDRIHVCYWSIV